MNKLKLYYYNITKLLLKGYETLLRGVNGFPDRLNWLKIAYGLWTIAMN